MRLLLLVILLLTTLLKAEPVAFGPSVKKTKVNVVDLVQAMKPDTVIFWEQGRLEDSIELGKAEKVVAVLSSPDKAREALHELGYEIITKSGFLMVRPLDASQRSTWLYQQMAKNPSTASNAEELIAEIRNITNEPALLLLSVPPRDRLARLTEVQIQLGKTLLSPSEAFAEIAAKTGCKGVALRTPTIFVQGVSIKPIAVIPHIDFF